MTLPQGLLGGAVLSVLAVASTTIASTPNVHASWRCTKAVFWGLPSASMPHFIGVATADSMPASTGDLAVGEWTGHFGPGRARAVHGQVVAVERVGTVGLGAPFDDPSWDRRVLVVPWDYDASCDPVHFAPSVVWNPVGDRSLYWVRLRPREHWTGGVPTFDALSPRLDVYPHPGWNRRDARPDRLTVDELFALLEAMPDTIELESDPPAAVLRFSNAVRAAGLTDRYPAPALERNVSRRGAHNYVRSLRPSITGTYRIVVGVPSGTVDTVYLRTASRPTSAWHPGEVPPALGRPGIPDGYRLWGVYGPSPELPDTLAAESGIGQRSVWPLRFVDAPPEAREVYFELEVAELERMFPESAEIRTLIEEWRRTQQEAWRTRRIQRAAAGRILVAGDAAHLELDIDVDWDGEPDIVISGDRLDRRTAEPDSFTPRWPATG